MRDENTTSTRNLRFNAQLLSQWRRVMDAAQAEGAFPADHKRTLSGDVNLALLAAVSMSEGNTPQMQAITAETFELVNGLINGKVIEMLTMICARLDLSLNAVQRGDYIEVQIGDLDEVCVIPVEHYRQKERSEKEGQLAQLRAFVGRTKN